MRVESDRSPVSGQEEPVATPMPMGKLKVKGPAEYADSPPPVAPPQESTRRKSARQDAVSPPAAQGFAFDEESATGDILMQTKENGVVISLTRNGDLQVVATGYSCRIRIDMEGAVEPEPEDEAASRDLLLRLVRERFRAELERECGPLPEELAAPPRK